MTEQKQKKKYTCKVCHNEVVTLVGGGVCILCNNGEPIKNILGPNKNTSLNMILPYSGSGKIIKGHQ